MVFDFLCYLLEEDYIEEFKLLYGNDIITPEGLIIYFNLKKRKNITHFWRGGKNGLLNKSRAGKIRWIGEILKNTDYRVIKINPYNNLDIYFISIVRKKSFVVRCREESLKCLQCVTAYPINPNQRNKYLNWDDYIV